MSFIACDWTKYFTDRQPEVIFDVGSYDGADSIMFKRQWPMSSVFSFEAEIGNYNRFHDQCAINGVTYMHFVVSDVDGVMPFRASVGKYPYSGSIIEPDPEVFRRYPLMQFGPPVEVKSVTINTFCQVAGVKRIDILHMDVQGAEARVVSGFGGIRPYLVFAEMCAFEEYKSGMTPQKFKGIMAGLGYTIAEDLESDVLFKLG